MRIRAVFGAPGLCGLIPNFCKRSQVRLRFFGAIAHSSALANLPWPKCLCELMGSGEVRPLIWTNLGRGSEHRGQRLRTLGAQGLASGWRCYC